MDRPATAPPPSVPARARRGARAAVVATAALVVATVLPGAASAHVTVVPSEAEAGSFAVVTFRVPNERDDAVTTRLRVVLPEDQPLGSVRTTPVRGWRVETRTRTLAEPIDLFGEQVSEVVSEVVWTATGRGIGPGEYLDLDLSLGPLPDSGELVFTALQGYSGGEVVAWNEVAVDGGAEPEHPAPVLAIVPAGEPTEADGAAAAPSTPADADADADADSVGTTVSLVLSVVAVLLAAAALVLSWRRRRA